MIERSGYVYTVVFELDGCLECPPVLEEVRGGLCCLLDGSTRTIVGVGAMGGGNREAAVLEDGGAV